MKWYGHVEKMGEERRGRPKQTWIGGLNKAMSERNLRPGDWEDRIGWKLGIEGRKTL